TGKLVGVNLAAIRMLDLDNHTVQNPRFTSLPNPEDRETVDSVLLGAIGGKTGTFTFCRTIDGRVRHFSSTVVPVSNGELTHQTVVICEDVTTQFESRELLRERERRYPCTSEGSPWVPRRVAMV
ncbi:MAG: PAS domain-containing protein, partial [Actinomycetota bacterium]|nr:PAS domain-containing protein [Actinomycetota bacterium]